MQGSLRFILRLGVPAKLAPKRADADQVFQPRPADLQFSGHSAIWVHRSFFFSPSGVLIAQASPPVPPFPPYPPVVIFTGHPHACCCCNSGTNAGAPSGYSAPPATQSTPVAVQPPTAGGEKPSGAKPPTKPPGLKLPNPLEVVLGPAAGFVEGAAGFAEDAAGVVGGIAGGIGDFLGLFKEED